MRVLLLSTLGALLCHSGLAQSLKGFTSLDQVDPAKKTVCSMTINSSEEIQAFQKHLTPKGFQFVELVTESPNWLEEAVNKNIRCDILVVSGHFGGSFFGHRGRLSLEDLETQACREEAKDLLHSAKEVFLFGCNTLAGKEKDSRTPEEYRRVLIEDGFSAAQAEQVASFRYSPIGQAFHARMSQVFSGVPRIYGYNSIGPSGKTVAPSLNRYLGSVDYGRYFDTITAEKNARLFTAMKGQALEQTQGVSASAGRRSARCFLADDKVATRTKLDWVASVLRDPVQRLKNLSEISSFLLRKPLSRPQFDAQLSEIQKIAFDRQLRSEMNHLITEVLKPYPAMQLQLVSIAQYFGWLTFQDARKLGGDIARSYFATEVTLETRDILCSYGEPLGDYVTYELVQAQLRNHNALSSLMCLKPKDPKLLGALVEILQKDSDPSVRSQAAYALGAIKPQDSNIHQALVEVLQEDSDPRAREWATGALIAIKPQNPKVHQVLLEVLQKDPDRDVRGWAASILGAIKPRDPRIHLALAEVLQKDPDRSVRLRAAFALGAIKPRDPRILLALVEVMKKDSYLYVRSQAASTLGAIKPQDPMIQQALVEVQQTDSYIFVRESAASALREISPRDSRIRGAGRDYFKQ